MGLPLEGYSVVEIGSALAGPYCGRILGDLGARIIKVEIPGTGDTARGWGQRIYKNSSAQFQAMNKEKDSLIIDFHDAGDMARLKDLIANGIDAVVQNLRPGVAEGAGVGAAACRALNPAIVYCNISAFGAQGPLADAAGYEPLLQAFSGMMEVTGDPDGPPARVGFSVNDLGTGMWASIGILGALLQRGRTGEGCVVDAALLDTAFAWQTLSVAALLSTGQAPKRTGLKGTMVSPNRAFETADGLLLLTIGTDTQFRKLCAAIGLPDLATDDRFAENSARVSNDDVLHALLEAKLGTRGRHEWWRLLRDVDVPAAPVQTLEEAVVHPQTVASGILQDPPDGSQQVVGIPMTFDGERPDYRRAAPGLGEGTDDI